MITIMVRCCVAVHKLSEINTFRYLLNGCVETINVGTAKDDERHIDVRRSVE